jgi:hypothetical protein
MPEETVQTAKRNLGSAKRGGKSARKQAGRSTPASRARESTSSKRRPPAQRTRQRAS